MEVNKLRSLIEDKIQHDYVDEIIQKPAIDEIKLSLLYITMKQSNLPQSTKESYILSTLFVQMALDIHEIVPVENSKGESKTNQKSRQLMVLAGDYYSGLFYSLLSETEDFSIIHILATAIREINENKMHLYYNHIGSVEEAIELLMKIDSLLVSRIIKEVQVIPEIALIEEIIIVNTLLQQKDLLLIHEDQSSLFNRISIPTENKQGLLGKLDTIIEEKILLIKKYIAEIPTHYDVLKHDLMKILENILQNDISIVKEG
ncbi:heptaprenyl diphosphate synthase component 1 [Virgibacillus sp. DJP39]|uniref:heptaprenyl diphosphate synthase component 1 n=1 Tax=Virgibacillus sp. DJP39 TaxID=3409790 RepID=UPI003BB6B6F7